MKYKSYIKYFLIFSLILISLLPAYNFYQYAKNYDFKKSFNLDYVEKYVNYTIYKLFNRSMVQQQVITGKDGFLFLGNEYNNILHKTNGTYRPSNEEISNWADKLKDLQKWYEDRGIKFVIVIAPNKHSIYKEKLPNWMKYDGETITDDIMKYSQNKNINILDLRGILFSKKNDNYLLYTKHDTHWNNIGSGIAYDETIDFLNKKYNTDLNKVKYSTTDYFRGKSPLGDFLKVKDLIKIEDNTYKYNISLSNIIVKDIEKDSFKISNENKNIINTNIYTNIDPKAIENLKSLNHQRMLFLCDSFSATGDLIIGNSVLYNETFSNVYKVHWNNISGQRLADFVQENKPDVVIYQIVERALYNDSIVTSMPNISQISIDNINLENQIFDIKQNNYSKNEQLELDFKNDPYNLNAINSDPIIILNEIKPNSKNVILSYEINSNLDTTFQLFYKKENNSNYNEADSYKVPLKVGNNKINLLIPSEYINNNLRVDLVSDIGKYKIEEFKIYSK